MKKIGLILLSSLLTVMLMVNANAAVVTRRSEYSTEGSAMYWAIADFSGTALISGSSTMKCSGGSLSYIRSSEGTGSATVSATLNAPNVYNVSISKTVYNTSPIVY